MVGELRELADALSITYRHTEDNIRNGIALCGESIREKDRKLLQADCSTLRSRLQKARANENTSTMVGTSRTSPSDEFKAIGRV